MTQRDLATTFHRLHTTPALVLPNAWDAGSARLIEHAGVRAIATTSAGVAWAHGRRDGQALSRAEVVETIRSIVKAVGVPVSADIESGYGQGTPDDIAETVEAVVDAGAVGINIEDGSGQGGGPLRSIQEQAALIRAARQAAARQGVNLFINARTDVYLAAVEAPESRADAVIRRAAACLDAGADGIFVPALTDAATIAGLVGEIDAPLNVMVGPGAPSVQDLANLGVARVSLGPSVALGALGLIHRAATEALNVGTYRTLDQGLSFGEADGLFTDA